MLRRLGAAVIYWLTAALREPDLEPLPFYASYAVIVSLGIAAWVSVVLAVLWMLGW